MDILNEKRCKRRVTARKSRKTRRIRKTRRYKRGGTQVKCCMCEKTVAVDGSLRPRACLEKHGSASHRICQDCWWNNEYGFAREGVSHECPGCKKGLPLTLVKPSTKVTAVIDLTDDA